MGWFLELLWEVCSWGRHWRWNLCFWSAVVLAFLVAANIPAEPLRWIVGGAIILLGIVIGSRWDRFA